MKRPNKFAARVDALSADDFEELCSAIAARKCKEKIGFSDYGEAAAEYRADSICPGCGSGECVKDGHASNGLQRYRCKGCGRTFGPLTGTVLEYGKKDLAVWVDFVACMCYNVQIEAAAEICNISHQTAYEWRHRVFTTVDGYQRRTILKNRVWIDEMYVADSALKGEPGWTRMRGLSKNQICIVVAIDVYKNVVVTVCGHGKPSSKRIRAALESHIEKGATIVHDMEKSHRALVRAVGATDEAHRADTRDPAYLEGMNMINSLCSWIRRYLFRHAGMKPENLQSYLNWYVYLFRVKQAKEKWPKTERVVRHLIMTDASYRSSRGINHQ